MSKQTEIGQGFILDKEKGIMKDGKVIFTPNQLTALILYYDVCKEIREGIFQKKIDEELKNFFGGSADD